MIEERHNKGFIKTIVIIVVVLILLAYWGYDLRDYINFERALTFVLDIWNNYVIKAYQIIQSWF